MIAILVRDGNHDCYFGKTLQASIFNDTFPILHWLYETLSYRSLTLDGSQDQAFNVVEVHDSEPGEGKDGKLFFTPWTVVTTVTTVTSRWTDTATTVSLTYYCTAGGIETPTVFC